MQPPIFWTLDNPPARCGERQTLEAEDWRVSARRHMYKNSQTLEEVV